jgi:hypothetical protein
MEMRSLIYWMILQILIGIWLFISPFLMGFRELTSVAVNNMVFGAIVVILGIGVSLYRSYPPEGSLPGMEHAEKKTT